MSTKPHPESIDLHELWKNRDREKEANDRAAARWQSFAKGELGCLTGRAWLFIQGKAPPIDGPTLPVACGRGDTQRYISWSDVQGLIERGEPMLYEVTCPECFKLWDTFARNKWDPPSKAAPETQAVPAKSGESAGSGSGCHFSPGEDGPYCSVHGEACPKLKG